MRTSLLAALFLSFPLFSQSAFVTMPTDGTTDTVSACSGVLVDGGGINGNYTANSNGYVIINPPGNDTVTLNFSTWSLYHTSDGVQIYDGVGTSANYLGWYSSTSAIPTNIKGTTGALTIRFYTNSWGNSAGFIASWSTSGSTTPTANFTYSAQSQNYSVPIQFVNTSSDGGASFWDFGDGTTSTDQNPTHSFTTSGTQTITLIESNCFSSDTTSSNLTISNGPNLQSFVDTIEMTVDCGTTATEYWSLTNGANAGPLNVNLEIYDTTSSEHIHFDSDLEGTYMQSGFATLTRSTSAAQGTHSLRVTGANSAEVIAIPVSNGGPGYQPTYFSYRTRATSSGYRACKFQMVGDNATSPSILGYTFWYSDGRLGLRRKTLSGSLGFEYLPNSLGNWAFVEYRNIDWSNETFDLYIDGSYHNSYSFLNPTSNSGGNYASYLRLVNDYTSDVCFLDDIRIGFGSQLNGLSLSPTSSVILGGNNFTFSLTFDASGFAVGSYATNLLISSNDTTIHNDTIPVFVTVEGGYEFNTLSDTLDFGSVAVGRSYTDSLMVLNTGCADLLVDSLVEASNDFAASMSGIAYGDTGFVHAQFTAPSSGSYVDSFIVYTPDSSFTRYYTAVAFDAPTIALDSSEFNITVNGCPDSADVSFWIYNNGQQPLTFENQGVPTTAPPACPFTIQLTDSYGDGWNGARVDVIDSEGNILYTLGASFYTGTSYDESVLLCSGETYSIVVSATGSYKSEIGLNVIENGTTIATYTNTSATNLGTQMAQFNANCGVPCSNPSTIVFDPTTGSVAASDSQLVVMKIYTDSLFEGTYLYKAFISSNDPVDSVKEISINLTLDGISETYINRSSCYHLDTLVKGGTYLDSVFVENFGCDSLFFNSLLTTNAMLSATAVYNQIGVGDSGWVLVSISPTSVGNISDTVFINTSDTVWPLCYTGYVAESPNAWVDTSPITLSIVNCGDSVGFSLPIVNTISNTSLDWSVTAAPVLNVLLVNYNVYPSPLSNLNNFIDGLGDMNIRAVTTLGAAVTELDWADVVVFPSITSAPSNTDYTNIEDDMEAFINDGGKMIIIGSPFVADILAMDFISGYYYGNYTNYTHVVNSTITHPYTQGLPASFTALGQAMNSRILNVGTQQLVYYSSFSHSLTVSPIGDGELIYFAYNWNQVYSEIETMMGNILNTTLNNKPTANDWIEFTTTSGTTLGGDTTTVFGTAVSDSLNAGVYNLSITVTTNDPTAGNFSIPVTLTLSGKGESVLDSGCKDFGSSFQNMTHVRNVAVFNTGCDTLTINSAATAGSDFSSSASNIAIAPGDTGYVPVSLNASTIGSITDTLSIFTDADTVYKCLTATIVGASDIQVTPNPISVTINKCNSFTTVPYTIANNGSVSLTYDISVAEVYDSAYTQNWLYGAPNYSNQLNFTFNNIIDSDTLFYDIVLNGAYSATNNFFYLYLNNSYVQTFYDNNAADYTNDTITGFITGWQLSNAITAGYFEVRLYSYNQTNVNGQTISVRLRQSKSVNWASPVGFTSGSVTAGNSISKSLIVTVSNLALGTYNTSLIIETNDPSDPLFNVPMTVNVVSEPEIDMSSNALNYGTVYDTQPRVDSIIIENTGCTDLNISNVTSNNVHFIPGWTSQTIPAGTAATLPITFTATNTGLELALLTLTNNDSLQIVSLQANVVFAPIADYQFSVQNNCTGLVNFSNESSNGSLYYWSFDDGTYSSSVNPTHAYSKPGTYNVMLVTTNAGGSDTIIKTITLNDVLFVDFTFPTTVQAGQVTQFIDSSMYPVSWQWFFGDGNNSNAPNPQHTYANKGTFIVTLLAQNSAGCSESANKQVDVQSGIGLDEAAPEDLLIYPVPTTGILQIETAADIERISIYNLTGQFITEVTRERRLDLSQLPAGTYMLRISGETWVVNRSIELLK